MKPPAISANLYHLWCCAWLHLTTNHTQRVVQWLTQHKKNEIEPFLRVSLGSLEQTLNTALLKAKGVSVDDITLIQIFGCLRQLEALHRTTVHHQFGRPMVEVTNDTRHVLLPHGRGTVREAYPEKQFKLSTEIGTAGELGFLYHWLPLEGDEDLDWGKIADLDPLREAGSLRVGLAPCASSLDMAWSIDEEELCGLNERAPLQCTGARDAEKLWVAIEKILVAAYAEKVQILLFPELVFDSDMLNLTRAWLVKNNLPDPRLRLVVAGSRHCVDEEGGWSNRCTVLGQGGATLWEQDKRLPFVLDDKLSIERIQAGVKATSVVEPTRLGKRVSVRQSAAGILLTPICLDFINGKLWSKLGADLFLVPAMTPRLTRFEEKAKEMGNQHGAASFVCNAQPNGEDRQLCYLPIRESHESAMVMGCELFTIDVNFVV